MRVIAGSARRLQLKTVSGLNTRPTTDRIKETLFNMLQNDIVGCTFLDLYSGSGAIGIEALSRGARCAVFVENNNEAAECIRDNLVLTGLSDRGRLIPNNVLTAINVLCGENVIFDIVFMDPPYNKGIEKETLIKLSTSHMIDEETLIIVEASLDTDFSYASDMGYDIIREKRYKTNKHIFLKKLCAEECAD